MNDVPGLAFGDFRSLVHARPLDMSTCVWVMNARVPHEERQEWLNYAYGALHDLPDELSIVWFLTQHSDALVEAVMSHQGDDVPLEDRLTHEDLMIFLSALAWSWDEGATRNVMMARRGMYVFWQHSRGEIEFSTLNADFIPGLMGDTQGWHGIHDDFDPPGEFTRSILQE